MDAVVIGPLNIDLILSGDAPRDIEALTTWFGLSNIALNTAGSAGYPAMVLQKLGLQTGVISLVANDTFGDVMRRDLADHGIDVSRVQVTPEGETSIAIYLLLFGSKKRPLTGRAATHKPWPEPLGADDLAYIASARLVHFAGYLHYPAMWDDDIPNMLRQARARGQLVSLDPQFPLTPVEGRWWRGVERLLPHVDVLLVDQDESRSITGIDDVDGAASMFQQAGPPIVVIKRGAEGSLVYHVGTRIEQPAYRVAEDEIADTIGAGDAYDSGFLAALVRGRSVAEAAKIGSAAAAISVRGHGAAAAFSSGDTIDSLIARYL